MKFLTLVLISVFLVSCASAFPYNATTNPQIHKVSTEEPTTIIRTPPFNPQNILRNWKPLEIHRFENPGVALVVLGNPAIEWTEEKIETAFDQPIPEGNVTSAIAIVLSCDRYRRVYVLEFMFVNSLGILEFYVYDKESGSFIRKPHPTQKLT
jgi:hypothetical protein